MSFRLVSSDRASKSLVYEAAFWEGPVESGKAGRRVPRICNEQWIDRAEYVNQVTGEHTVRPGHPLCTAPSVSYYRDLLKAFARIGCRP